MDPLPPALTRAAVWHGSGSVVVESLPTPTVGPGEVLVDISLATVCGSDLHTVSGRRPGPCPSVLGHEAVGRVRALGPGGATAVDGTALRPGDRVVWTVTVSCGECDRCRAGLPAKCRTVRKVGHESIDSGWALSGGYAERILLPRGTGVALVPETLSDPAAAPAACSTATVTAAVEAAGPLTDRRVLVCGAGMLGLHATAMAAAAGASEVVVVDPRTDRLTVAEEFGATRTLPRLEAGLQADVALDFSGAPAAIGAALDALDIAGRLVLVGSVSPGPRVPLDPERVVRRWLTIAGVHNYQPRHLATALAFLASTTPDRDWASLVAPPLGLADLAHLLNDDGPARHARASVVP